MKRREFTTVLGYGWIGLNLGLLAGCGGQDSAVAPVDPGARAAIDRLAGELGGIDFIGPVCDRRIGSGDPLAELLERLPRDAVSLIEAVQKRIAEDFRSDEVLEIDGWKLSRSECLLAAGAARMRGLSEARRAGEAEYRDETFMEIERWGPDNTIQGEIFNPIGNGRGGFWLRVNGPVNGSMRLVLDGVELATHFEPGVITASLEPAYMDEVIATPGAYELMLIDKSRMLRQTVGVLQVSERPPMATLDDGTISTVFCEVERWGPDLAVLAEAFNRQPDGSAAFWVRIGCAPNTAVLQLDGVELATTVRPGLVTARVPHYAELERGQHPVVIFDPDSGERLTIGNLEIQ